MTDDDLKEFEAMLNGGESAPETPKAPVVAPVRPPVSDDDDDPMAFLENAGLTQQGRTNTRVSEESLLKPWMKFHKFVLVKTIEEVTELVDRALAHGRCALDLETEGFDNRVYYSPEIHTIHKIVGFCISVRAVGYYIPVRHKFDATYGEKDPNVPVKLVEAEIRRLCQASQPILTPEGLAEDPLGSPKMATPPRVRIYFWNSKFDQEYLFPITGIDFWHPASFEDGMLATYVHYTDDELGLKDNAFRSLVIYDPDVKDEQGRFVGYPYEMIKTEELFPKGLNRAAIHFANLYPAEGEPVVKYGGSDAICTELLCESEPVDWDFAIKPAKTHYANKLTPVLKDPRFPQTYKLEKQVTQAVRVMERTRMGVNLDAIEELLTEAQNELDVYEGRIKRLAESKGFMDLNPGSPEQLSDFLFGAKGLDINPKPDKTATQQYKTDAKTLENLFESNPEVEVFEWIVKWRQIGKIIGTYLTGLSNNCDAEQTLRFKLVQTGAATGRFTAPGGEPEHGFAGIPPQGIPARNDPKKPKVAHSLRKLFKPRQNYALCKVDYAGQELRVVTNLSREPVWMKEFKEGSGDLHTITAKAFFGDYVTKDHDMERTAGKIANFSLIYGGGAGAIMRATKCEKIEASRRKANFDKSVPTFAEWVQQRHNAVKKDLGVMTAFGRFIRIPDANLTAEQHYKISLKRKLAKGEQVDENKLKMDCAKDVQAIRAGCERKATNYPIQGCLQGHARVLTTEGYLPIEDMVNSGRTYTVWTGDVWAEATARDMGECQYATITLADGTEIPCDTRHKVLGVKDDKYEWIDFQDIQEDDVIATSVPIPAEFSPTKFLPRVLGKDLTEEGQASLWYVVGQMAAFGREHPHQDGVQLRFQADFDDVKRKAHKKALEGLGLTIQMAQLGRLTSDWLLQIEGLPAEWEATVFDQGPARLPSSLFQETLANRRHFLMGFLDRNHRRVPRTMPADTALESKATLFLQDAKLLFRSVGVESCIFHRAGHVDLDCDKNAVNMYIRLTGNRLARTLTTPAPAFLCREFANIDYTDHVLTNVQSNIISDSRREKNVNATVLRNTVEALELTLSAPVYSTQRVVSKSLVDKVGPTYTLSVNDPLHRFDAMGVITKNSGADILKISLVKLTKEFTRRGWLKTGGDDSVRMVLTVHDEVVFEIRLDRLMEAVPVIVEIMESPGRMVKWDIPLIVEPLLGQTWEAKLDWYKMLKGKVDVPEWLKGYVVPNETSGIISHEEAPKITMTPLQAAPQVQQYETPKKVITLTAGAPVKRGRVATFALPRTVLTPKTVDIVRQALVKGSPSGADLHTNGYTLHLTDQEGNTLIDPDFGIRVIPERFSDALADHNLGPGGYLLDDDNG